MLHRLLFPLLVFCFAANVSTAEEPRTWKFDFGPGKVETGYTAVAPDTVYDKTRGYGFEPGEKITGVDRGGENALQADYCTSDKPFHFSVAVPEGNYRVAVTMGDRGGTSQCCIKGELRRLCVEECASKEGTFATREFIVNVRTPKIASGSEVRLKDREKTSEWRAWDEKLTLEFNGARPCLAAITITAVSDIPTVYLLGDSTVCDQPAEPYASWGQMLPRFFGPKVAIANHAESGESLRGSRSAKRLEKVLSTIKKGDYLLLQFGHNDMKAVTAAEYQVELKRWVHDARAKAATVVLITPMHRRTFAGNKITNSHRDFPDAVRALAKEENVPLIDLHAQSQTLYETLGPEKSGSLFKTGDGTHHNNFGAYELARSVATGIQQNKLPLASLLADDFQPFDPAKPDAVEKIKIPASPVFATVKPEGQ